MAYKELRKLYYGDETTYKQTYLDRFHSDAAIKLNFEVNNKPAFFIQSNEVIQPMYNIFKLDKEITQLCGQLPPIAAQQYSRKCLIDEIVLSNNIEGVHSSRKEIGQVLNQLEEQSEKNGKRIRFLGLVNKYVKLMSGEKVALNTCQDIRDIYDEIVLAEVVEEDKDHVPDGKIFRKDQTTIRSATDKVIHVGMTPEGKIIDSMEKALAFLNDESVEKLYRVCIYHYMLEYIHPFYDGNGRLGRFIFSYCISETLEPLLAYRISETIKENIKDYYNAFVVCNDSHNLGDLTPFLIMMLGMINAAAVDLRDSLNRKLFSWNRYQEALGLFPMCESEQMQLLCNLLVQASLFSELGISTKELVTHMNVSYATVKKYLDIVAAAGLLLSGKEGKEKFYNINMAVLDDMLLEQKTTF